jgi:PAS domain S-box-containing protein
MLAYSGIAGAQTPLPNPSLPLTAEEQAWLEQHPGIRLGAASQFAPIIKSDANGNHSGLLPDLIGELNQLQGDRPSLHVEERWQAITQSASDSAQADEAELVKGLPPVDFSDQEWAWLRQHPTITLGYTDQFPPDLIRGPSGQLSGMVVDYIELINHYLDGRIALKVYDDWAQVTEDAIHRKVDGLASSTPTPTWDRHFIYSKPYNFGYFYYYALNGDPRPPRNLNDLAGRRVGYMSSMKKAEQLLEDVPVQELVGFSSNEAMADALLEGRVDLLIKTSDLDWWRTQSSNHSFRITGIVEGSRIPLVISIRKDWPQLQGVLDKILAAIPPETHRQIGARWFGTSPGAAPAQLIISPQEREWLDGLSLRRARAEGWMPFSFRDGEGEVIGIIEDYWGLIRDKLDIKEQTSPALPFSEVLAQIRSNDLDLYAGTTRTPDRAAYARFSDGFERYPIAIATRRSAAFIANARALEGEVVAVGREYSAYRLLKARYPGIDFLQVEDTRAALAAVEARQAFAAVDILPVLQYQIESYAPQEVRLAGITDVKFELQMMVRDELVPLVPLLNRAIAAITPEERLTIHKRWMLRDVVKEYDYGLLLQVIGVGLLLLAAMLYWNRRLHIEVDRRTLAEQAHREISDRLTKIADRVPGVVYQYKYHPDGRSSFPYSSKGIEGIYGVSPEAVQEDAGPVFARLHPDDIAGVTASIQTSARDLSDWELDYRVIHPQKGTIWVSGNASPQRQDDGSTLWHGHITDITPRKEAEQAQQYALDKQYEAEHFSRATIDALSAHLCVIDENGVALMVNRAWRDFADANPPAPPDYGVGVNYLDILRSDSPAPGDPDFGDRLEALLRGEEDYFSLEYFCPSNQGDQWFQAHVNRFEISGKAHAVVAHENVTQRKRALAELITAREAAEAANQAKSAFLANMSHELRTPLNAILGFAQVLLNSPRLPPALHPELKRIRRGGDYLLTLINDILDLSKIEAGRIELFPEPIHLPGFLREATEMVGLRAEQKGLVFEYHPGPALPKRVICDLKRLRQVLLNLLGNAVKFTDHGYVRLHADYADGHLCIRVKDSGPGIPIEDQQQIFQPFAQSGDQHSKIQGTGLGLSISARIVELMGGKLTVESEPGHGSCFHFRIPLETALDSPDEGESRQPQQLLRNNAQSRPAIGYRRPANQPAAPLRLVVVDDVEDNRQLLCHALSPLGFELEEAESGEACLELVEGFHPDLVLMDVRMPGLDGLETMEALHQQAQFAQLPVILVTAQAFPEDRERALARGGAAYLGKPVDLDALLQAIGEQLGLEWQYQPDPLDSPVEESNNRHFPPEWLAALREALTLGYTKQIKSLFAGYEAHSGRLPAELREWLEAYEYEQIFRWIERQEGNNQ